ncbi:MAG TPA: NAD(P)H-binding protein [Polyangiaceae bacterium]|nr:NAD(P)H-binding protein [Polyangiaceae bacterium]
MIVVTGATGHVGKQVAELLAERRKPLRLLVRDKARAPSLDAELAVADYADSRAMIAAFDGAETAFIVSASAPPGERARLHASAFDAAKKARVKHVVYLSLAGAAPSSPYPYARDHHESERALLATGLDCTIVRNGKYTEQLLEPSLLGLGEDATLRAPDGSAKVAWISRADTARVLAHLLEAPPGGVVQPTGPEAPTLLETAERLARALDRQITFVEETLEELRERALATAKDRGAAALWIGSIAAIAAGEYEPVDDAARFIEQSESLEDTVSSGVLDALRTTRTVG